jgi:hypothetical protein
MCVSICRIMILFLFISLTQRAQSSSGGLLLFSVFSTILVLLSFSNFVGFVGSFLKKLSNSLCNSLFMASFRSTISACAGLGTLTGLSQADGKARELETPFMMTAAPTARFCCEVRFDWLPPPSSLGALLLSIFSILPN